jgi:hypothetical protein
MALFFHCIKVREHELLIQTVHSLWNSCVRFVATTVQDGKHHWHHLTC